MNDNIIINTISKLHFIIVSALLFIFLTLSISFILLQNGVYLKNISLPNLQIKKLYIKWNEKLNISIQEAKITKNSKKEKSEINLEQVNKIFKSLLLFDNWFQKIEINKISFSDINASFRYVDGEDGYLIASSNDFSLRSSLFFQSHLFNAKIDEFHDYKRNIKINGNIIFDGYYNMELISSLSVNINNDIELQVYTVANREKLLYKVESKKNIKNIKHTIEMLGMPDAIKYWAYDAIEMSDAQLKGVYGWLEYDRLQDAYKNIHVLAVVNNLSYTYNPKLEPIVSKRTELEFKNGIFYIRPREAYQYGFYLDKSWLKIDFTKEEELLSIILLFKGKVNNDLLYLLSTYDIELPFLQHSGSVDTNLKIEVGLRDIDVTAKGDFYTKEANFNYLGLNIDIFDARIFLDNYDVTIKNMYSKYKDIATAVVDVEFDTKNNKGKIDFRAEDINFKDIGLNLKKSKEPLKITYNISNNQDIINVQNSTWEFKGQSIDVERLSIPFYLDTLVALIPTTLLNIDSLASAYASGTFSLNPIRTDLDIDLLKFTFNDIKMRQSSASLKVRYDNKFIISSNEKIRVYDNNLNYALDEITLEIEEDRFQMLDTIFRIEDLVNTEFNTEYFFSTNSGTINLKNLKIKNSELGEIFSSKDAINLQISLDKNETMIRANEFNIDYVLKENAWKLKLNSLQNIAKKSKLLQDYNITNGNFTIYKNSTDKNSQFLANTKYPYKLLVVENKPIENYMIKGIVHNDSGDISLNINSSVDINISKDIIKVNANSIGIDINEVLNYFDDRDSGSEKKGKNVIFSSRDCYLYISKDRHVISDSIDLQYFDEIVSAQLAHKNGGAGFELKNGKFYLYGEDFNDEFMEKLFALSKFKDGAFSFFMAGSPKEYDGIMQIKNTTILDYKILNNVLAFVNTIPSLVTFSIPGYSKNGLEVKSAYLYFHTKDDIFRIQDISLDSKEMDIVGRGTASFKHNDISLKLNLKTDLGSSVSKIPLVGYIILGEDTVSTSMKISGKLNDPDVKSLIAKDIVVAPLNIIKRILLLPFHLIKSDEEMEEVEEVE